MAGHAVFYGLGVGPGDPELLTLKAVRVLENVDTVFVPRAAQDKESLALSIAKPYIRKETRVVELLFPMTRDRERLEKSWDDAASCIREHLERGERTAFLTVGDPMLYSTYIYLYKRVKTFDYPVITVPGIPSICAAAASAGFPLGEGDDKMALIPWSKEQALDPEVLGAFSSLALLKVSSDFDGIIETLNKVGFLNHSVLVSRCGHADERIEENLAALKGSPVPYFSLILARKENP